MRRLAKPPKVLYYVDYSCGHWDVMQAHSVVKLGCTICEDYIARRPDVPREVGQPIRMTRYVPKAKP